MVLLSAITPGPISLDTHTAVAADAKLDGKFLLRTSDPTLSAADVALGYRQLLEVERSWQDTKTTLELRPVYHRRESRIRSHVLLCWLSLLLVRLAEDATGETWRNLRTEMDKLHLSASSDPLAKSPSGPRSPCARRPSCGPPMSPSRPATSGWPRRRLH